MPYKDLRAFLSSLRQSGELVDVTRPIALQYDVAKALAKSSAADGPALLFEQNGTEFSLVAGLYGNRRRALIAFEATDATIHERVTAAIDNPIGPVDINGPAPCQEVIVTGDDIDLTRLPVPTYSPRDGGPYITAGIVVSEDPDTGIPDIGNYRFQLHDSKVLGVFSAPNHRFGKNMAKAIERKVPLHGAIVIGVDPMIAFSCQVQGGDATNDWFVAGGLRGEPVELVQAVTSTLKVPAHAEFIIEFMVDSDDQRVEGPLGEYTGYYTPASLKPTAKVTAITHRKDAIFQGLLTGKPITENHVLKQIPFEASILRQLQAQFPTISDLSITSSGGVQVYVVIAMTSRYEGEARQAILAAMASNLHPKWVVVVDPDIDIRNSSEVEWAKSFRVKPREDVFVVDRTAAAPLDPYTDGGYSSSVGIDATKPFGVDFPEVSEVPGWRSFDLPEIIRSK
ncbi:4-hydroxy-3-polyprenylbenzoate decarboxylase/2,5-furandicarboxylate decarboxylase 1 [Ancylobacter aquaticus]|uniref:4-hydroxy-3-polyprenylbenzoate decarboxylase/2,5-furandicarboxylate decarboxylase 1 n=1 Tax=Ancylobacter aquaticus TaxID=100 RepID=A0A4R1HGN8_ANCAQ|nr:UbiD family decarboxylase [Ancylobacter aquaticus]TCK19585.1 4-hydroxy-3-polyprenylbenzoate decarboxylase/2,5-furandicarboxylate decarboxylase 1 [Ancylobacter aquaticus]